MKHAAVFITFFFLGAYTGRVIEQVEKQRSFDRTLKEIRGLPCSCA